MDERAVAGRVLVSPDEVEEIRRWRADGNAAFGALYRRYWNLVFTVCLRQLGDPARAEDAAQDTFLKAQTHFDRFDDSRRLVPWLVAIAGRRCIDLQRRNSKTAPRDPMSEVFADDAGEDPLEGALAGEQRRVLREALTTLKPRQRRALLLHALDGWNYDDIASAEGISVGSVKSLIFRARANLRKVCAGALGLLFPLPLRRRLEAVRGRVAGIARARWSENASIVGACSPQLCAGLLALAQVVAVAGAGAAGPAGSTDAGRMLAARAAQKGVVATAGARQAPMRGSTERPAGRGIGAVLDPASEQTPDNTHLSSIEPSPAYAQDHTLYATGPCWNSLRCGVLFVSRDGGASWTRLPAQGLIAPDGLVLPPAAHPDDRAIYAMTSNGLAESTDGGATFVPVSVISGLPLVSPLFADGDQRILVLGEGSLWEYRVREHVTRPAGSLVTSGAPVPMNHHSFVAFSPGYREDGVLFAGVERLKVNSDGPHREPQVWRCRDQACEFVETPGWSAMRLSPSFAQDGVAYGFAPGRLVVTVDRGRTFEDARLPDEVGFVRDLEVIPGSAGRSVLLVGERSVEQIYRSDDAGATWRPLTVAEGRVPRRLVVTPSRRIIATFLGAGLACSDDGGLTWAPRCAPE